MWKSNRILSLALAAAISGCSSTHFVPPDSATRERFQSAALLVAPYHAPKAIGAPVKGSGKGALSGAGQGAAGGALFGLSICAYGGPLGCLVGLPVGIVGAGVGAIGGGIVGGVKAHSEEAVGSAQQDLLSALETTAPDAVLGKSLPDEARTAAGVNLEPRDWAQSRAKNYVPPADEGFGSAVEVTISIGTGLAGRIDPDLRPVVLARARMLSVPEGRSLYERQWMYYGQERDYFDAAAADAKLLHRDLNSAYAQLAKRIVFDLYVNKETERKSSPTSGTIVTIDGPVTPDSAVQTAAYRPAKTFADCDNPKKPERPWEGYWRTARDDATLTLEIGEQKVSGDLQVRAKRYPISGTVDDTGHVRAVMDAAPGTSGGMGRLQGPFPEIEITSVGVAGMGQRLALFQGKVFRLCD